MQTSQSQPHSPAREPGPFVPENVLKELWPICKGALGLGGRRSKAVKTGRRRWQTALQRSGDHQVLCGAAAGIGVSTVTVLTSKLCMSSLSPFRPVLEA